MQISYPVRTIHNISKNINLVILTHLIRLFKNKKLINLKILNKFKYVVCFRSLANGADKRGEKNGKLILILSLLAQNNTKGE